MKLIPLTEGCSDGGCIFGHPGGMHTNGGCECMREIRDHKMRIRFQRNILLYRKIIEAQTKPGDDHE